MDITQKRNDLIRSIKDPKVKDAIIDKKYSEAIDLAPSVSDAKAAIEIFLLELLADQWKKISYNEIEDSIPLIVDICYQLGIRDSMNPFLTFIKIFKDQTGQAPSKEALIIVNNAYADSSIDYEDIIGKGEDKTSHLIFNKHLYDLSEKDAEYMLQAYKWLSNKANIKEMDLKNLNISGIPSSYRELAYYKKGTDPLEDKKHIRNTLIFVDPKAPKTSALNSQYYVETALSRTMIDKGENSKEDKLISEVKKALKALGFKDKVIDNSLKDIDSSDYDDSSALITAILPKLKER